MMAELSFMAELFPENVNQNMMNYPKDSDKTKSQSDACPGKACKAKAQCQSLFQRH